MRVVRDQPKRKGKRHNDDSQPNLRPQRKSIDPRHQTVKVRPLLIGTPSLTFRGN